MEQNSKIQNFERIPSAHEFESQIESKNFPAVFKGCVKEWKAFSKWNPYNGGLDYLQERVGSSVVEAMLSKSEPVFYGDIRSHERVPIPFSSFIGFCKQRIAKDSGNPCLTLQADEQVESDDVGQHCSYHAADTPKQLYLAQVPMMNVESQEKVQLELLREDTEKPAFLEKKTISSINLWMNNVYSRSSTHYDPHHNLLCVVAGCKKVTLWPPSASSMLYTMPIYGEASNHSSVSLENPDFSTYPRAVYLMEHSQKVILHAGDALFIPEGWFHQVDSDNFTIAVNFWWRSDMISNMSEHMDAYYLRHILRRLIDMEMDQMLCSTTAASEESKREISKGLSNGKAGCSDPDVGQACMENSKVKELEQRILLHNLESHAIKALHELTSLVYDNISVSDQTQPGQSVSSSDHSIITGDKSRKIDTANSVRLEDDLIAKIIWNLKPLVLQDVLLAMAHNFPRTLEGLILHLLSPVGAEVLTRKFDEMDQLTTEEDRNKFYEIFHGAFNDQLAAMDVILAKKESFSLQAFNNVLDKYMGVNIHGSKPVAR